MMKNKIGIIGYSGKVGAVAAKYLEKEFIVLKGSKNTVSDGKEYIHVDVRNENSILDFCRQCKVVINCAGPSYKIMDSIARMAECVGAIYIDAFGGGKLEALCMKNNGINIIGAGCVPGLLGLVVKALAENGSKKDSYILHHGGKETGGVAALMDIVISSIQKYGNLDCYLENGEIIECRDVYNFMEMEKGFCVPIQKKLFYTEEDQRLVEKLGLLNFIDYLVYPDESDKRLLGELCYQFMLYNEKQQLDLCRQTIRKQEAQMKEKRSWFVLKGERKDEYGKETILVSGKDSSYITGLILGICGKLLMEKDLKEGTYWLFEILDLKTVYKELEQKGINITRKIEKTTKEEFGEI